MTALETDPLRARLKELEQETDFDFVVELIDIFLAETPKQLETIEAALSTRDLQALMIAAHTLKGSGKNLGASQLGTLCFILEDIGRNGKEIPDGTSTKEIREEFARVKSTLLAYKQHSL